MKKILTFLLCVVYLCIALVFPANAISANYFKDFKNHIEGLAFEFIFESESNANIVNALCIGDLINGAVSKKTTTEKDEFGENVYRNVYELSPVFYEKTLSENIAITNIEDFKNLHYTENMSGFSWNLNFISDKNIYQLNTVQRPGGWGSATIPLFYGYHALPDGTYHAYCYEINRAYEKPDNAVLGVDYILHDGAPAEINDLYKFTISYNGEKVRFLSWEHIVSIPNKDSLITADTKIDTPVLNTSSNEQTSTPQQTTSSQNKSPSSSASQNQSNDKSSSGLASKQETTQSTSSKDNTKIDSSGKSSQMSTSQQTTDIQNNVPESSVSQSQANDETSSGLVSTQETTRSNGSKDNTEIKTKKIVLIAVIILATTLIVGVVIVFFFMLKKKIQR